MMHSTTRFIAKVASAVLLASTLTAAAASMDARLNMAKRLVSEVEAGLSTLKAGDTSRYNALSAKLTKAADLLKKSESKEHPDYVPAIQQWGALQKSMAATAQRWQAAASQAGPSTAASAADRTTRSPGASSVQPKQQASGGVNADAILVKYQRANRPILSPDATAQDTARWAQQMKALQSTELQSDLAALNAPGVKPSDRNRVSRWISGTFQTQIADDVRAQFDKTRGAIAEAMQLATLIDGIAPTDTMRAYNFANGANGEQNALTLQRGLQAVQVAEALGRVYPDLAPERLTDAQSTLGATQKRFQSMQQESVATGKALAKLPKKQKAQTADFLAPIAQEFWLRGSVFASIDAKGNVWIGSTEVGDIESNGKIWVRGNQLGSIEPDGKVWFRGNSVGSLEPNGQVWRRGTQVGLIENDGTVWIDGNSNGEITPYQGEWKRAAILYYFQDFFAGAL